MELEKDSYCYELFLVKSELFNRISSSAELRVDSLSMEMTSCRKEGSPFLK